MSRKVRFRLEPGVPLYLVDTSKREASSKSLTLVEFNVQGHAVSWIVKKHDGSLIEGRFKGERPMRYFDNDWLCLAIPCKFHMSRHGAAPDFIANLPGRVIIAHDPQGKLPIAIPVS